MHSIVLISSIATKAAYTENKQTSNDQNKTEQISPRRKSMPHNSSRSKQNTVHAIGFIFVKTTQRSVWVLSPRLRLPMYIMKRENIITCYCPVKINTAHRLPYYLGFFFPPSSFLNFSSVFLLYHRRLPHCCLSTEIIGDFIRLERQHANVIVGKISVHRLGIKPTNMGKESGEDEKKEKKGRAWGTCRTIEDGWAHLGPSRLANRCMVLKKRRRRAKNKETETNRQRTVFDVLLLMASRLQTNAPTDWETRKKKEQQLDGGLF